MNDHLINTRQAATVLGLSARTLEHYRTSGGGPNFIQVSPRCVRYRRADLDAWIDGRIRRSTADEGQLAEVAK